MSSTRISSPAPSDDGVVVSSSDMKVDRGSAAVQAVDTVPKSPQLSINVVQGARAQVSTPPATVDTTDARTVTWEKHDDGWGDGREWLDGDGYSGWGSSGSKAVAPQITSLTSRSRGSSDYEEALFHWRPEDCPDVRISHKHISQYARGDLSVVLETAEPKEQSVLDRAPTAVWARTQIIRSLPEAQRSNMPGPRYTLSQLSYRRGVHDVDVHAVDKRVSDNKQKMNNIRDNQQKMREQIAVLERQIRAIEEENTELKERQVKLSEVSKDLGDLEALALAYC
ncbi:hypothetical protein V5O48_001857 [Marasmius crinis-equi]|uniref:Uncharacterized protein n=1 Tax=Marasmius crinis-equi TaxID=585013 RepID=A0ABR3FXG0_9AGAR